LRTTPPCVPQPSDDVTVYVVLIDYGKLIRMSTGWGCLNAHQQLSAITGTLPAMRRNDCPRRAGTCRCDSRLPIFSGAKVGDHSYRS
jgi:hypothetical protein